MVNIRMASKFLRLGFPPALAILLFLNFGCKGRTFTSQILGERRTFYVHLPADYEQAIFSYPVLYILDAYPRPSTYGISFFDKAKSLEALTAEGIPPMIIVGIKNKNRVRDMLPVPSDLFAGSGSGADDFLMFLNNELIPFIDKLYRTSDMRILYGRSDSGLFVLYALSKNPLIFDAYISSSPTIGHCPQLLQNNFIELFSQKPEQRKTLFIVYGENDIPLAKEFIPELKETLLELAPSSFRLHVDRVLGEGHIPETGLEDGIRFLFDSRH